MKKRTQESQNLGNRKNNIFDNDANEIENSYDMFVTKANMNKINVNAGEPHIKAEESMPKVDDAIWIKDTSESENLNFISFETEYKNTLNKKLAESKSDFQNNCDYIAEDSTVTERLFLDFSKVKKHVSVNKNNSEKSFRSKTTKIGKLFLMFYVLSVALIASIILAGSQLETFKVNANTIKDNIENVKPLQIETETKTNWFDELCSGLLGKR